MAQDSERPIRRRLWEFVQAGTGILMIVITRQGKIRQLNEAARHLLKRYGLEKGGLLAEHLPELGSGSLKEIAERFSPSKERAECVVELNTEQGQPCRHIFRAWKLRSGLVLFGEPSGDEVASLGGQLKDSRAESTETLRLLAQRSLEVRRFSAEIEEMGRQLERSAHLDPLTGLPNRRQFLQRIRQEWDRYQRYKRPYSLLLVGIDRLTHLSQLHGMSAVEAAIVMVGELLKGRLRRADYMARFGDDEFAVLLYETDGTKGATTAQLLRDRVAERKIVLPSTAELAVTVGGSEVSPKDEHPEEVLRRAGAALRKGRIEGEDRAVFITGDESSF